MPYYLVKMTGVVAGERQTLYAAVLDNGRIVEPTVVSRPSTRGVPHRPGLIHHHILAKDLVGGVVIPKPLDQTGLRRTDKTPGRVTP
jgi:hypothetical protein